MNGGTAAFDLRPVDFARGAHVATDENPDVGYIFAVGRTNRPLWTLVNGEDVYRLEMTYCVTTIQDDVKVVALGKHGYKWHFVFEHDVGAERFLNLTEITVFESNEYPEFVDLASNVHIIFQSKIEETEHK